MHGCPKSGSLFTPIANDVVDARRLVNKTFFSWKLCFFRTRKRHPNYFSENGEKSDHLLCRREFFENMLGKGGPYQPACGHTWSPEGLSFLSRPEMLNFLCF